MAPPPAAAALRAAVPSCVRPASSSRVAEAHALPALPKPSLQLSTPQTAALQGGVGATALSSGAPRLATSPAPVRHSQPRRLGGGARRVTLLWFSGGDLRLHDHAAAAAAAAAASSVLPVFFFDPADASAAGFRRDFLSQSVLALRAALRERGSDLLLRCGRAEALLPELARAVGAGCVHATAAASRAGRELQSRCAAALDRAGCALRLEAPCALHAQPPFSPAAAPATFAAFRAALLPLPVSAAAAAADARRLPLGCPEPGEPPEWALAEAAAGEPRRGGEAAALRALADCCAALRGAGSAAAAAASLAPWLALGCLSPRRAHAELADAMRERGEGGGWLSAELLWSDFFRATNLREALRGEAGPEQELSLACA